MTAVNDSREDLSSSSSKEEIAVGSLGGGDGDSGLVARPERMEASPSERLSPSNSSPSRFDLVNIPRPSEVPEDSVADETARLSNLSIDE